MAGSTSRGRRKYLFRLILTDQIERKLLTDLGGRDFEPLGQQTTAIIESGYSDESENPVSELEARSVRHANLPVCGTGIDSSNFLSITLAAVLKFSLTYWVKFHNFAEGIRIKCSESYVHWALFWMVRRAFSERLNGVWMQTSTFSLNNSRCLARRQGLKPPIQILEGNLDRLEPQSRI